MKELGEISLRMVKILLENGNLEVLATNLSQTEFHTEEIKELYHMISSTKLLRYMVLYISCNNRIGFVPVKFSNCNRFFSVSYAVSIPHLI